MTQPSFSCPRCGYETFLPSDVRARYCPSCQWTGDSLLGSDDVLAQAEIDGPFATMVGSTPLDIPSVMARWAARYGMTVEQFGESVRRIREHAQDPANEMEPAMIRGVDEWDLHEDGSYVPHDSARAAALAAASDDRYCLEHNLYDCWYAHAPEPTRAEIEADWFGPPVGGAPGYAEIAPGAFDREHPPLSALPPLRVARGGISADGAPVTTCDLEADLEESLRDPAFRASYEAAEARSAAARSPAPTFRVARFVQALRRLRR